MALFLVPQSPETTVYIKNLNTQKTYKMDSSSLEKVPFPYIHIEEHEYSLLGHLNLT